MPQDCFDCFMREKCCGKSCSIQHRKVDCSMKSVEGLIDTINKKANSGQWNEAVVFGVGLAVKVIKDYCEVSEEV